MGRMFGQADSEDLFATALLQDMAVPLLAKELPQEYEKLFQQRRGGQTRLSDLEMERFGWTHAQAASILARRWSLPDAFAELIECHTKFDQLVSQGATPGQVTISLSAMLPSVQDNLWHERDRFIDVFCRLSHSQQSTLESVLTEIDAGFEEFAPVLKLGIPPRSLVAWLENEQPATA